MKRQTAILDMHRRPALKGDAKAHVVLTDAGRKTIEHVSAAVGRQEIPAMHSIVERFLEAPSELARYCDAKNVILAGVPAVSHSQGRLSRSQLMWIFLLPIGNRPLLTYNARRFHQLSFRCDQARY